MFASLPCRYPKLLPLLLPMLLLPPSCRSECLANPNRRHVYYESCQQGWAILQDIAGEIKSVPSASYCARVCLTNQSCASFNVQSLNGSLDCQLSTLDMKCTDLYPRAGTRAYKIKSGDRACSRAWRLALVTQNTNVVTGSVANLRAAILRGAATRVLWEPDPLPEDMNYYEGRLYTLDAVQVVLSGQVSVVGYAYTYSPGMNDLPLWTLLEFDSAGSVYMIISNRTEKAISDVKLSWMVLDKQANCFQPEPLSDGLPVQNPALAVESNQHMGKVSDLIHVLQGGSTMSMLSLMLQSETFVAFAYPTYTLRVADSENTLQSRATWLPGNRAFFMPLRIQRYDFSGDGDFEVHSNLNTTDQQFAAPFKVDENLFRTEVYLDPCWELAFSVDHSGQGLAGDPDQLITAVHAGSRLLLVHNDDETETVLEAEIISIFDDGYVLASSKMGVTSDDGINWQKVSLAIDGSWWFTETIEPKASDTGTRHFYTEKTERPYRYTRRGGADSEGSWAGARQRLQAGLIPRVRIELQGEQLYFDIECVGLSYIVWHTYFMSYRSPYSDGFEVYVISLDGYFRADSGKFRGHGSSLVDDSSQYSEITLFFEEMPNSNS